MEKTKRSALLMTALCLLALSLTLVAATYAWFTFDPYTNVTPMEAKISEGDVYLLISQNKAGPFDKKCPLTPTDYAKELRPVSTVDGNNFYTATKNNGKYATAFRSVNTKLKDYLIHGTVYLQARGGECKVFFNRKVLTLGTDAQVLAAGRLALKITVGTGKTETYIFNLDALGTTAGAKTQQTVTAENVVVSSLNADNSANFVKDPSQTLNTYFSDTTGAKPLCTMKQGDIATVEYWVYLEGCDTACITPVQNRDVALQLAFRGEPVA